jgi:predicted permease
MISFFLISLPIFAVIGVGWAATRTRLVAQGALDALNAFSFRFALPALLLRLTGLALPEAITRFLGFLGGAAGPAALFALGGALALQRLDRRTAVAACLITVARLAVYPMLVWLILGRMMQLDAFWVNVGVLIACLPSAGNIYVLAQRYDTDPQQVSAAILLSTIVSVASFPCVAWLALD